MIKIALDFDGIISDFTQNFLKFMEGYGYHYTPEEINTWYIPDSIEIDIGLFNNIFADYVNSGEMLKQKIFPGAIRGLKRLLSLDTDIAIFTSRPYHANYTTFEHFDIPIVYCDGGIVKAQKVKRWGADVFADDNLDFCIDAVKYKACPNIYLWDHGFYWFDNPAEYGIMRVAGWDDLYDKVFDMA